MSLSIQEQMLIEQRVTNDSKSPAVVYLLLIFFGWFGIHRFYLGRTISAVIMLLLTLIGFFTLLPLFVVGFWCFIDLFLIPGMIRADSEKLRERLKQGQASTGNESPEPGTASPQT